MTARLERCPRCGETLTAGFLRTSGRQIIWTPANDHRPAVVPLYPDEFTLPGAGLWHGACCPSQYCGTCGLILTETEETP